MKWDGSRIVELNKLRELLIEVTTINRGSHAIERIQKCEELAEDLWNSDLDSARPSFHQFLTDLAIKDRSAQS